MDIIYEEGNDKWYHPGTVDIEAGIVKRWVQVRRYEEDTVVEMREFKASPDTVGETWDGSRSIKWVVPTIERIALANVHHRNEITRAAIRWYDTGKWSL